MLILIHVIIALSSITFTSYTFFWPSMPKLKISYGFIAGTLLTGVLLVVSNPSNFPLVCIDGLIYLAFVLVGITAIHLKLVKAKEKEA